jgi:hypothetical protein
LEPPYLSASGSSGKRNRNLKTTNSGFVESPFILTPDLVTFPHNQKSINHRQVICKMSITIHMHIQVKVLDDWKAVYDGATDGREKADIHATPYKELDDPNHVHVIATAPSKETFQTFFSNSELQKRPRESITGAAHLISHSWKKPSSASAESHPLPVLQLSQPEGRRFGRVSKG